MSTDEDTGGPRHFEHTPRELREMDEGEARQQLTVAQFERWEKLNALHDDADEQQAEWADHDERVTDIAVKAEADKLGTEVDLFGNDVVVHIDSGDDRIAELRDRAADRLDDHDADDPSEVPAEAREAIVDDLLDLLDAIILQWNGHDWRELSDAERGAVLEQARDAWGADSLMEAAIHAATAYKDDREELIEAVDSFHGEERGRGR